MLNSKRTQIDTANRFTYSATIQVFVLMVGFESSALAL